MTAVDRLAPAVDAARAAGADDVEVSYAGTETEFVRFASSRFTQVGATRSDAVRVRVLVGGKPGSQMCASLEADALAATARAAVEVAALTPALDVDVGFARGGGGDTAGDDTIAPALSATGAPALLADAFAPHRSGGVLFAGALKAYCLDHAVLTSGGCRRAHRTTAADAQVIGLYGDCSGYAGAFARADAAVDLAALAATAADKAVRGADPIDLPAGPYDVVLAPAAVAELVEWMAAVSFGANAILDGTSLLAGREGAPLCDPAITIGDRPLPGDPGFDAEGSPRAEVTFIDAGTGGRVVTDRVTAARLADPRGSTGHAQAIDDEFATGPAPRSLYVAPGDASEADLIAATRRGLYVTRLHYVNGLLNPRKATMTGMTRDGTFLIEDGQLTRGVANLRFTEHMLEAFSRVGGVTRTTTTCPTWWSDGGSVTCPAILIRDFAFTGTSR